MKVKVRARTSRPVDHPHQDRPLLWHKDVAVCIPSAGRVPVLAKMLHVHAFLNDRSTFIGVDRREAKDYQTMLHDVAPDVRLVTYDNPDGSVAVCREALRKAAIDAFPTRAGDDPYRWKHVVVTDDNASFTHTALQALVGASRAWREQPCIVAGFHGTAQHFDRNRITEMEVCGGYRTYPQVAMIFQVYPASLYAEYSYPPDAYGLDDRHLVLWAIAKKGLRRSQFRVAMDAPFRKSRYQSGGQGPIEGRARKTGLAIARLALDFPEIVGTRGTLPIAWQLVWAMQDGQHVDRLAGGSMRSFSALTST